jgi:hypothetical protein
MPHAYKHLYPLIYDPDNLWRAWRAARRGGSFDLGGAVSRPRRPPRPLQRAGT